METGKIKSSDPTKIILFVEDDETIRNICCDSLEKNGYEVWRAADGVEALEVLAHTIPAVIFLDINMPRMNGFRFFANLRCRQDYASIPVILSSSEPLIRDIAAALGTSGCLPKCPSFERMQNAILHALAKKDS